MAITQRGATVRPILGGAGAQTRLEPAAPIRSAQVPQNRFSQRAADRKSARDGLGDARGLVRVARPRGGPGTSPRSCQRPLCRCLRHAPWAGRAAPSRGRSAGIAASEPDPGVRRRPPPLLRDASVPHTHQGIRMVVIDSSRAVVRCHQAALRSGPARSSCKCLFRADPQAPGVGCVYQDISLAWLGLDLLDFLTTAQR